jgi:hypothetical protein
VQRWIIRADWNFGKGNIKCGKGNIWMGPEPTFFRNPVPEKSRLLSFIAKKGDLTPLILMEVAVYPYF